MSFHCRAADRWLLLLCFYNRWLFAAFSPICSVHAEDDVEEDSPKVDKDIGKAGKGSRTDDEVLQRSVDINLSNVLFVLDRKCRTQIELDLFDLKANINNSKIS
jgi:hypothetical protein